MSRSKAQLIPGSVVYVAVENDGDLYIGTTDNCRRREQQHAKNGRTVFHRETDFPLTMPEGEDTVVKTIGSYETDYIHFYHMQSQEEDFNITNILKRIPERELDRRYPERNGSD